MFRKLIVLGIVVGIALIVGNNAMTKRTVTGIAYFREKQVTYTNQGNMPGGTAVWHTKVLLPHKQSTVGDGRIACIAIDYSSTKECFGTYILPLGRIKVQGEISNREHFQMAIVGGTGVYTGNGGVAQFSDMSVITFYLSG